MNVQTIAEELNRLYEFEIDKYISEVNYWKNKQYTIYRNDAGQHKVVEPVKYNNDINKAFNGIFQDIFKGE